MKIEKSGYVIEYDMITRAENVDPCVAEVFAHSFVDSVVLIRSVSQKAKSVSASLASAIKEFLIPFSKHVVLYHTSLEEGISIKDKIVSRYNSLMRFSVLGFECIDYAVGIPDCSLLVYRNEPGIQLDITLKFVLGCDLLHEARHDDVLLDYLAKTLFEDNKLMERLGERQQKQYANTIEALSAFEE